MPRCKTCRWWGRDGSDNPRKRARECGNHSKIGEPSDVKGKTDTLTYSYDEGGRFWTGPEFGCVHHETMEV